MGIFFEKPTKGPDVTGGGVWPIRDRARLWNRCGAARELGDLVQLAWTPGEATEISTSDRNSYIPGASNDTIWNTFIDTITNTAQGSSRNRGGAWGVVLDTAISDNKAGNVCLFGQVMARVQKTGTDHAVSGDPLAPSLSNSLCAVILSNHAVIATYTDAQTGLTNRTLRRVFLHQGLFSQGPGSRTAAATAFT